MDAEEYLNGFVSNMMKASLVQNVGIKQPSAIRSALRSSVLESTATPKQIVRNRG